MKCTLFITLILASLALSGYSQVQTNTSMIKDSGWQRFSSRKEGFTLSVSLPVGVQPSAEGWLTNNVQTIYAHGVATGIKDVALKLHPLQTKADGEIPTDYGTVKMRLAGGKTRSGVDILINQETATKIRQALEEAAKGKASEK
jgi:hypothetical protein